eukprot:13484985-Alexandrium_andersonii.AAC.1
MFKRLRARPLRGRWGSVATSEKHVLQFSPGQLHQIWRDALANRVQHSSNRRQGAVDEVAIIDESSEQYVERMSRWVRESDSAIMD